MKTIYDIPKGHVFRDAEGHRFLRTDGWQPTAKGGHSPGDSAAAVLISGGSSGNLTADESRLHEFFLKTKAYPLTDHGPI